MKQYVAHHIPALQNQVDQLHHKQVRRGLPVPAQQALGGDRWWACHAARCISSWCAVPWHTPDMRPLSGMQPRQAAARRCLRRPDCWVHTQDLGLQAQRELKAQVTQVNLGVQELEGRINEMHATMEATQEQANQGIKLLCRCAPHPPPSQAAGVSVLCATAALEAVTGRSRPMASSRVLHVPSARLHQQAASACVLRRVIGDLLRGNSPSKTSTLQDLDKYVNQPHFRGVRPPVPPSPVRWRTGLPPCQASGKQDQPCTG